MQHARDVTPIDEQDVVKMNRDTLYPGGIFDVTGPLKVTKPEAGGRFQFEKNDRNVYVVTDRNAVPNADGSITVHFGGDPDQPN